MNQILLKQVLQNKVELLSITLPSGTEEIEIIGSVFGQDVEES